MDHPTLDPGSARPYDPNKDGAPPASNPVPQPSQGTNIQIDPQAAAIVATTIMVIGGIAMLLLTGDPSALSHAFA